MPKYVMKTEHFGHGVTARVIYDRESSRPMLKGNQVGELIKNPWRKNGGWALELHGTRRVYKNRDYLPVSEWRDYLKTL